MISKESPEYFQFPEELEQVLFTDPDHTTISSGSHHALEAARSFSSTAGVNSIGR
jgi:hypothetical protein